MAIARGEVYEIRLSDPAGTRFVVVLSSDVYNAAPRTERVLVAPIVGRSRPAYSVPLRDTDPVSGHINVGDLTRIHAKWLDTPAGMLTGATVAEANIALKEFLDLPG